MCELGSDIEESELLLRVPLLLFEHLAEDTLFVGHEGLGRVEFDGHALVHHKHLITLDDGVESVGDAHDCCSQEFLINELLNCLFGDHIDVRGGFVEDDDFVAAEDSPDDADELALADAEVLAFLLHFEFEALAILFLIFCLLVFLLVLFLLIFSLG